MQSASSESVSVGNFRLWAEVRLIWEGESLFRVNENVCCSTNRVKWRKRKKSLLVVFRLFYAIPVWCLVNGKAMVIGRALLIYLYRDIQISSECLSFLHITLAEKIEIDQAVWSSTVAWLSGWCLNHEKWLGSVEHFLTVLLTELKTEDSIKIPAD